MRSKISKGVLNNHNTAYLKPIRPIDACRGFWFFCPAKEHNREYYLTNVANLTITFPSGNFECWISIITSASFTGITLPTSEYIGDAPEFGASEKWEVSIKNGVIIAGKVE